LRVSGQNGAGRERGLQKCLRCLGSRVYVETPFIDQLFCDGYPMFGEGPFVSLQA
jgi:hypothetical protein